MYPFAASLFPISAQRSVIQFLLGCPDMGLRIM